MRVAKVLGRFKVAKHFRITITDDSFHYQRNAEKIVFSEIAPLRGSARSAVSFSKNKSPGETDRRRYAGP